MRLLTNGNVLAVGRTGNGKASSAEIYTP